MSKLKSMNGLFDERHFDREIIILYARAGIFVTNSACVVWWG